MAKTRKRLQTWQKTVVLVIVAAMVLSFVAAGLIILFGARPSVTGTYRTKDGRQLSLAKGGTATLSVSGQESDKAPYKVSSDAVEITVTGENGKESTIPFDIEGSNLRSPDGTLWIKQK